MTANEARALMPRNQPSVQSVLDTGVYPRIRESAKNNADGVSLYVLPPLAEAIASRLRGDGYIVGATPDTGQLSIQWYWGPGS